MSGKVGSITTGIITDGLVFNMDAANRASYSGTGIISNNTVSRENSGSFVDGVQFNETDDIKSFQFDGVDDYIDFGAPTAANSGSLRITGDLTISMWFKTTATSGYFISDTPVYGGCYSILIGTSNQTWARRGNGVSAETNVKTSGTYNNGNWYNITFVSDSTMRIYMNSVLDVQTIPNTPTSIGGTTTYKIGDGFSNLAGQISSVQIYNRALSVSEVTHNYNALKGRFS